MAIRLDDDGCFSSSLTLPSRSRARALRKTFTSRLAARTVDTAPSATTLLLEHGRMSKHIWQNEVSDLRTPQVHLLEIGNLAVATSHGDTFEHRIHVVLAIHQMTTVHLPCFQLACHGVPNTFVQQFDGDAHHVRHCAAKTCGEPLLARSRTTRTPEHKM